MHRLEETLKDDANVLRVSIHSDVGQTLRQRYAFQTAPLFIIFDSTGREQWRGRNPPSAEDVLGAG